MDRLEELCLNSLASIIVGGSWPTLSGEGCSVRGDRSLCLPNVIAERLFVRLKETLSYENSERFNTVLKEIFQDRAKLPLRGMDVSGSPQLTDSALSKLLLEYGPHLQYLNIQNCPGLSSKSYSKIAQLPNLKELSLGGSSGPPPNAFTCPRQLISLTIHHWKPSTWQKVVYSTTFNFDCCLNPAIIGFLSHLDLSGCSRVKSMTVLKDAVNLKTLILYRTKLPNCFLEAVEKMKCLRHLDISWTVGGRQQNMMYYDPQTFLRKIILLLPRLQYLDISGTNLDGTLTDSRCGIPGLISRVGNPLQFLGLFETKYKACLMRNIPAEAISGNADFSQIIHAFEVNLHRASVVDRVLKYMQETQMSSINLDSRLKVVHLFVDMMKNLTFPGYLHAKGLRCLSPVICGISLDPKLKKSVLKSLMNLIQHYDCSDGLATVIIAPAYGLLRHFHIPKDIDFCFQYSSQVILDLNTHLAAPKSLLAICKVREAFTLTEKDNHFKYLCGTKVFKKCLDVIQNCGWRLRWRYNDEIFEAILSAWRSIRNLIARSPELCQRFIESRGLNWVYGYRFDTARHAVQMEARLDNVLNEITIISAKNLGLSFPSMAWKNGIPHHHQKSLQALKQPLRCLKALKEISSITTKSDNHANNGKAELSFNYNVSLVPGCRKS